VKRRSSERAKPTFSSEASFAAPDLSEHRPGHAGGIGGCVRTACEGSVKGGRDSSDKCVARAWFSDNSVEPPRPRTRMAA
jgi:hypothetical protein